MLSVAAAGLAAVWLVQTRGGPAHLRTGIRPPHLPLESRVAWTLVAMFALLATGYYGLNSWLPDSYQDRGWGEDSAGAQYGNGHRGRQSMHRTAQATGARNQTNGRYA